MTSTRVAEPGPGQETRMIPHWKVILHDDPVTTFEFSHIVLRRFFGKSDAEARRIAREAHNTGSVLVAVLPFELAEFKVDQVHSFARPRGYPLKATLEPAD